MKFYIFIGALGAILAGMFISDYAKNIHKMEKEREAKEETKRIEAELCSRYQATQMNPIAIAEAATTAKLKEILLGKSIEFPGAIEDVDFNSNEVFLTISSDAGLFELRAKDQGAENLKAATNFELFAFVTRISKVFKKSSSLMAEGDLVAFEKLP